MARVQSRLLIVVAAALALPGCTDNEMMGNITAVLGMIAGAIGVIQKMAASTQGIATRVKTGVFVFVTGLCLGCTGCFWLFVDENFQFETAFSRAGQRLGELFKEKTPPPEQAKEGAMDEAAKDQPAPHNWLIARATCPKCRYSGDLVTAFKFGECALRGNRLGDQGRWGGKEEGTRTDSRVWVRAFAESCPNCGEEFLEFAARVERNQFMALQPVADASIWRGRNWVLGDMLR